VSTLLDTLLPPERAQPAPLPPSPINTEAGWKAAVEAMDWTAGITHDKPPTEAACTN
jgi:hypothetical protein